MDQRFIDNVLDIVLQIPFGYVASYKQIATLAGKEKNARQVGKILSHSHLYGDYPCHRVVNASGRLCPGWDVQYDLLIHEGVVFKKNGCVDMKVCQWNM